MVVDGKIRWCWLELGRAGIMLQEYGPTLHSPNAKQARASLSASNAATALAIYRDALSRALEPSVPSSATHVGHHFSPTRRLQTRLRNPTDAPKETDLRRRRGISAPTKNKSQNRGKFSTPKNRSIRHHYIHHAFHHNLTTKKTRSTALFSANPHQKRQSTTPEN